MKVLIHDHDTRLYYAGEERWTPDRSEAHDFKRSLPAMEYACSRQLSQAELVYDLGDAWGESIVMPILTGSSPKRKSTVTS